MSNSTAELKDRIEAKRLSLQSKLSELKADTRHEATEAAASIKKRLEELEENIKDGWEKMTEAVSTKLNAWLDRD